MSLKVIQLNIEGDKHYKRFIPFLQAQRADVICLQEVFAHAIPRLENALGMKGHFVPTCFDTEFYGVLHSDFRGNLTLSRHRVSDVSYIVYHGDTPFRKENHVAMQVTLGIDGQQCTIINTHFPWTPKGSYHEMQQHAWNDLAAWLGSFPNYILCGDFNAPRGREMFSLLAEQHTDNLPGEIKSTLDPVLHREPSLRYVVDTIFSKGTHSVSNVSVIDGVSDHKAIVGMLDLSK